ncbi:pentapeptide repeat-containing protein [Nonomuraea sp. NPDC049758]|uniref:pentapeptide repeat-containing protein n=1 Tax=Nonomuraea sp. NPDC049758 TaxID=3154360 RepID=UPI00341E25BA
MLLAAVTAATWAALNPLLPAWLRWTLGGVAMAATTCLMIGLLIGPAARRLSGERVPISEIERKQMTATERIEALNAARHTLIQAATGLVVIGGVAFTALGLWYTARTVDTAQQGQITDRYTKAVEQLGSAKQDVRLGGIYALQRLAGDSPRDRNTVIAVLSAYVRGHDFCTLQPERKKLPQACDDDIMFDKLVKLPHARPGADVVAALTVAAKLTLADRTRADLSQMRFPSADLTSAFLPGVDLSYADLSGADLHKADLRGADLHGADLSGANLYGANLSGADLRDAVLRGADLSGGHLNNTDLSHADLFSADLRDAALQGVSLRGSILQGASLRGLVLSGVDLRGADLRLADLRSTNLRGANLGGADLRGAGLSGADLRGADLRSASLLGIRGTSEKAIRQTAIADARTRFGPWTAVRIDSACWREVMEYLGADPMSRVSRCWK